MSDAGYYAVAVAAVLLTAVAHLLLKKAVQGHTPERHIVGLWLNVPTVAAYAIFLVVTLMNLYAYRVVPLRAAVVLSPLTLVAVTLLSLWLLRERLTRQQVIGCAFVLAGIAVYNL